MKALLHTDSSGRVSVLPNIWNLTGLLFVVGAAIASGQQIGNLYTNTALGLAGSTNGQAFSVKQTYGDAVDVYVKSNATAVYQQTRPYGVGEQYAAIQARERDPAVVPPYPYTPIFELHAIDQYDVNRKYLKNRAYTGAVSGNLFPYNTGLIQGATVNFYTNGPAGRLTASRVKLNNTYSTMMSQALPAGTYTCRFKAKSNDGAGNQQFQAGQFTRQIVTVSVTESAWTNVTYTIDGSANYQVFFDSRSPTPTNLDILVDEFQIYDGNSIPVAFSAEPRDTHVVPVGGTRQAGAAPAGGKSVTGGAGSFPMPTFPDVKSFTEATIVAMYSTTDSTSIASKIVCSDSNEGVFDVGVNLGYAYGGPAVTRGNEPFLYVAGKGYVLAASRFKAGEEAFFLNGMKLVSNSSTVSLSKRTFGFCTDPATGGGFPFTGKITTALLFDKWLSDSELQGVFTSVKAQHALYGEPPIQPFNFYWSEGDSITAQSSGGGSPYPLQFLALYKTNWFVHNIAVSGSAHSSALARLPDLLTAIQGCVSNGGTAVVSYFMGANGLPTQQQIQDYGTAIRSAGARFIMCTVLPQGSRSDWETQRLAYNAMLRSNPSLYDALADFGASRTIGAFGAPTARVYYADDVHLNAAGETEALNIIAPIIRSQHRFVMSLRFRTPSAP